MSNQGSQNSQKIKNKYDSLQNNLMTVKENKSEDLTENKEKNNSN